MTPSRLDFTLHVISRDFISLLPLFHSRYHTSINHSFPRSTLPISPALYIFLQSQPCQLHSYFLFFFLAPCPPQSLANVRTSASILAGPKKSAPDFQVVLYYRAHAKFQTKVLFQERSALPSLTVPINVLTRDGQRRNVRA